MLKTFNFEKTPVVELVNEILLDSTKRGASDIHFDPQDDGIKTRIRIDGELIDYTEIPGTIAKNLITRVKIISGMNITESRLPQDGAIKKTLDDVEMDMRVSAIPTNKGEKIVIRILDYSLSLAGLESLGFNQENYKKVLKMISAPNGIILVTGATGSGKSTTVYSILQRLNKEDTNIISVEDPIEMDIEGVNQIQTNSEIGLDFATVLRSILRQDPNIIMIGEIRDTETAKIAVRASITGHLVLSTIHTNDSLNTIERLLDMEVERYLLASALTGIISQKLARKLCQHCKKLRPTNEYEKNIIKKVTGKEVNEIYTTVGCEHCKNGYDGRIAIHEVLLINQDIKDAISSNVKKEKLRHLVYNSDVISLLQDGVSKVLEGLTTLEELLKIIELDDDELIHSTGLENAIEVNELTKEDAKENNEKKTIVATPTQTINNQETIVDEMFEQKNNNEEDHNIDENLEETTSNEDTEVNIQEEDKSEEQLKNNNEVNDISNEDIQTNEKVEVDLKEENQTNEKIEVDLKEENQTDDKDGDNSNEQILDNNETKEKVEVEIANETKLKHKSNSYFSSKKKIFK
jgi:type IV pilus assembly protein PilB